MDNNNNDNNIDEVSLQGADDDAKEVEEEAKRRAKKTVRKYTRSKNKSGNESKAKEVAEKMKKQQEQAKKNAAKAAETTGKVMQAEGKATQAAGKGMQAAGKGMQQGGEAIKQASDGLGEAASAIPYVGGPLGASIKASGAVTGEGTKAAGHATEKAGKATEKAGKATEEAGKKVENAGKKLKKSSNNNSSSTRSQRIRGFLKMHLPAVIQIVLVLIAVLYLVGVIMFIITMPGLILGKLDDWGRGILADIQGFLFGDSASARIKSEDVINLAEHMERMGYDIQGYGLGMVEYKKDGSSVNTRNGQAKEINKIAKNVEGKEYLRTYLATNENTYILSQWSVLGAITSDIDRFVDWLEFWKEDDFKTAEEYSTGMINIVGQTDASIFESPDSSDYVKIDRSSKQMKIYSSAIKLPFNNKFQWGETFSYDLNNWVGRYGRPTELFLSLHLSTMMPDLAYRIATEQDFNTKVNIGLMDVNMVYEVTATKGDSTIGNDEINDYYSKYCSGGVSGSNNEKIPGTDWMKREIVELKEIADNGDGDIASLYSSGSIGNIDFGSVAEDNGHFTKYNLTDYQLSQLTFVAYREQGTDVGAAAEASLMANLFEKNGSGFGSGGDGLVNYVLHSGWFASRSTGSTDNDQQHKNIVSQVLIKGKRTLPVYVVEHDWLGDIGYVDNNGQSFSKYNKSQYVKDVTKIHQDPNRFSGGGATYTFFCFPSGPNSGIDEDPFGYYTKYGDDFCYTFDDSFQYSNPGIAVKWPFITSVTSHWFYNDIDFTKGVYRFAKAATKTIDYKPEDEDDILNKNNVEVKLDATLGSSQGIIYQVAEPEATGPNDSIKKVFTDSKYYRYDGTDETAYKIENAKAMDLNKSSFKFNGENHSVQKTLKDGVEKQEVSFRENKAEALAAFGILKNMHTEASDYIYRNLKELLISLEYFTTQELTDEIKDIMLWPIKTDNQNTKWETTKDEKTFGTIIKCEEKEKTVLAPSDAKVKEINGNSITLTFTTLNKDDTELLEYIYKDAFVKINREILYGLEMKIDNVKLKSSIKKGDKIKRGQELGTAAGQTDGKPSITITMYNLDKSIVENIDDYLKQKENNKYEELMKIKKEAPKEYKEGLDINAFLQGGFGGSSTVATGWRKAVVDAARTQIGVRYGTWQNGEGYEWGDNLTCSGLTWGAYKQAGIDIPMAQNHGRGGGDSQPGRVKQNGNWIDASEWQKLKPGDLVFYSQDGDWTNTYHVALYIGDHKIIEAVPDRVAEHDLNYCGGFIGGGTPIKE